MQKHVRLSQLRDISINFPGDLYVLAAWVLTNDIVWSTHQRNSIRRTTLHGLVGKYSMLNTERGDSEKLRSCLISAGLPLDATLEPDDHQTPNQVLEKIVKNLRQSRRLDNVNRSKRVNLCTT